MDARRSSPFIDNIFFKLIDIPTNINPTSAADAPAAAT